MAETSSDLRRERGTSVSRENRTYILAEFVLKQIVGGAVAQAVITKLGAGK